MTAYHLDFIIDQIYRLYMLHITINNCSTYKNLHFTWLALRHTATIRDVISALAWSYHWSHAAET